MFKNLLNPFNACALLFALVFLIGTGKANALTCSSPLWTGAIPVTVTTNQTTCLTGQDILLTTAEVIAINPAATGLNCVPSIAAGSPVTVSYYNPSGCGTGFALFTAAQYTAFLLSAPAPVVTPAASSPVVSPVASSPVSTSLDSFSSVPIQDLIFVFGSVALWAMGFSSGLKR